MPFLSVSQATYYSV